MITTSLRFSVPTVLLLASLAGGASAGSAPPGLRWRTDLETRVRFQKVLTDDLLLVGTERHLFGVAVKDGAVVWRLRNVSVAADQVTAVPGSPLLLIGEGWGGDFKDRQSSLLAVDSQTGKIRWETPTIRRQILTVAPDPDQRRLLLVTAREPHGKGDLKRELSLFLVDASSGALQWRADLGKKIRLSSRPRPSDRDGKQRGFDLAAYREPLFDKDHAYLFYDGIRCYQLESGRLVWSVKLKLIEDEKALSYAQPFLENGVLYLAARGRIRAFDATTGGELWKSKDFGVITELYFDDDRIYGRLGGIFLDFDRQDWRRQGPYGVAVVERSRGKKLWKWAGGDDGITNLLIFGDRVYLADRRRVIALDRYTGKRLYKRSHKFKRAPQFIGLTEESRLVATGPENAAAFDYGDGRLLWRHHLAPPGVGIWKKLGAGLLGGTGAVLSVAAFGLTLQQNLLPAVPAPLNRVFGYRGRVRRWTWRAGVELMRTSGDLWSNAGFARLEGHYQYYFTRLPGGGPKGLVGVNLNTGRLQHQLPLRETDDRLAVHEGLAMVFDPVGSQLAAYAMDRGESPRLER